MKYFLLLLLVGCTNAVPDQPLPHMTAQPGDITQISHRVYRVTDRQHGVVCYVVEYEGGISCLPLMEPEQ